MSDKKYEVGDKLFCKDHRGGQTLTVERVGRLWLHLSYGYRANIHTLVLSGSGRQCYESEAAYRAAVAPFHAWHNLKQRFNRTERPAHITTAAIHEAAKLLGIELGEEQGK